MKPALILTTLLVLALCGHDIAAGPNINTTPQEESLKQLKALDNLFYPFKLGMSIDEVQDIVYPGELKKSWQSMLVAKEYKDSSVRYFWQYMSRMNLPVRLWGTLSPCMEKANVVFLFRDNVLFAISYRVFNCDYADRQFEQFIEKIGAVKSDGTEAIYHKNTARGSIILSRGWGQVETWKYNLDYRSYDAPKDLEQNW